MKTLELSKRLAMNASLVPCGARAADIGCDHGYLSVWLATEKNCRMIAMDVREGPLSIAKKNIEEYGMSDRIVCRLSDGLEKLEPGEADTLLVAGMGGMLIRRILTENPRVMERIHTVILQPQSDLYEVRKCIYRIGFYIDCEAFCVDGGKDYTAIRARRAEITDNGGRETPYTEAEYRYGRYLMEKRDAEYRQYLIREKDKYENIYKELAQKKTKGCQSRIPHIRHILEILDDITGE